MGLSTPASLPNMLNTEEYLTLRQEAWENDGEPATSGCPDSRPQATARKPAVRPLKKP